ncbi:hypothetical protein GCM10028857_08450 [Salinarchaeum chitinilyticum]
MTCPHLDYRSASDERQFDEPRAYCTIADRFVQPMRAAVCNDRYALDHAKHCEIFIANADGDDTDPAESDGGDAS